MNPTNEEVEKILNDTAYGKLVLKGTLGAVPTYGSILAELIGLWPDKVETRKNAFLLGLHERLTSVEAKLDASTLSESELFFDSVMLNSSTFIRISDEKTRSALLNAVVSTALNTKREYTETMMFNRYLIDFTGAHLVALKAMSELKKLIPIADWGKPMWIPVASKAAISESIFRVIVTDLIGRDLIYKLSTMGGEYTYVGGTYDAIMNTTKFVYQDADEATFPITPTGLRFLEYIQF